MHTTRDALTSIRLHPNTANTSTMFVSSMYYQHRGCQLCLRLLLYRRSKQASSLPSRKIDTAKYPQASADARAGKVARTFPPCSPRCSGPSLVPLRPHGHPCVPMGSLVAKAGFGFRVSPFFPGPRALGHGTLTKAPPVPGPGFLWSLMGYAPSPRGPQGALGWYL